MERLGMMAVWVAMAAACGPGRAIVDAAVDTSTTTTSAEEQSSASPSVTLGTTADTTSSGTTGHDETTSSTSTSSWDPDEGEDGWSRSCPDGMVGEYEECDGLDLDGQTCVSLGYRGGVLACNPASCRFDTRECIGEGPYEGPGESPIESSSSAEDSSGSSGSSSSGSESGGTTTS